MTTLAHHFHGKSRVRLGRVWRDADGKQHFVEWTVELLLESPMEKVQPQAKRNFMKLLDCLG